MNNDAIVFADGVRVLTLPCSVMESMFQHERDWNGNESGGVLLGFAFQDHDEITGITVPSANDRRGMFSFLRRKSPAQKTINTAWNKSGGHVIYLGEWHTHPRNNPTPSGQDREMIRNALDGTRMEIDYLYLVIAGGRQSIWVGRQDRDGLHVLKRA